MTQALHRRSVLLAATIVLTFVASSTPSLAQIIGDPQCKDARFTASKVELIRKTVVSVDNAIEMAPPDEAEYIRAESQQALAQSNKVRYNAVVKRRYFTALEVHSDAKVALDNLDAARSSTGKDLARYLVVVLSRLGELAASTDRFINTDMQRSSPTLNDSLRQGIYYDLPTAKSQTVSLLQCVVSVL